MKVLKVLTALAVLLGTGACTVKSSPDEYPMFWTWLDYRPAMNFDSICKIMNESGIDGVMLNAPTPDDYRKAIPIAHKHGIEVYAWVWTLNLEHKRDSMVKAHPEWLSVNRNGESLADTKAYVSHYKFLCPALPEVRAYLKEKIKSYCEVDGLNGIAIDYHRFVDVVLPTTLWPKYDIVQDREYPQWDYGYHPAMIELFRQKYGYDPRDRDDPSTDGKWLQFRCDQITEVANELAEVVHSYGKKMGASPFPTSDMSRQMVRQEWNKWDLDIVFPMVYHNYYTGDASFVSDCTVENIRTKNPSTTLYCGLMATDSAALFDCMDAAFNNGAKGIAIFTVNRLRTPAFRAAFKSYADSVRALPRDVAVTVEQTASRLHPLQNEGVMRLVRKKIAARTGLSPADVSLGEFQLKDAYGVTERYTVMEQTSNQSIILTFYFYGGILSGWNVE